MNYLDVDDKNKLIEYFKDLLLSTPTIGNNLSPTFQSIAGYPNHENVLSNIYKFFLEYNFHGVGDLFLQSLDDCIEHDVVLMDEPFAIREYYTKKGGRIDLVIFDSISEEEANKVVIIENKIHHSLINDLNDYWSTFDHIKDRVGIILSIKKFTVPKPFINITHLEWIEKIKLRLGNYASTADSKYIIFLLDFIQYIEGFYTNTFNMESIKFLYEHGTKVEQLIKMRNEAFNHLRNNFKAKIEESETWNYHNSIKTGSSIGNKTGNIVLYIYSFSVFENKSFKIESWIYGSDSIIKWNEKGFNYELERIANELSIVIEKRPPTKEWARVGSKEYQVENSEELIHLDGTILKYLDIEWINFTRQLELRLEDKIQKRQ